MDQTTEKAITIGHLQTKNKKISLSIDSNRLVYSVLSQKGTLLALKLTKQELLAKFPDLEATITWGLAGNDASLMTFDNQ